MKKTVDQRKQEQGFQKKAPCCASCKYFELEQKEEQHYYGTYIHDINLRCSLGAFKVGKSNWCRKYETKQEE